MKIKKIVIENYKGFINCSVDFNPNVNIFIGNNASGKTTLLTALLKSSYNITNKFVQSTQSASKMTIKTDDINYNNTFSSIYCQFSEFQDYPMDIPSYIKIGQNILAEEEKKSVERKTNNFVSWFRTKISISPQTIPIIKFYPANRGSINYVDPHSSSSYQISQLEAWKNIFQDNLSYSNFFQWYFENETNELRFQRDNKNFELESPALKDVRLALKKTFKMLEYGDKKLVSKQVKRLGNSKQIPILVLRDITLNQEELLDNKSDGEKAIITLIVDIAYNLSIAKDFVKDDDFLSSPGIVMIDEIETHLHPKWQREIIEILTKIFPNIQYFISTHSPQIISSVKSENVYILQNFEIRKAYLKTYGEDTNSLLKYIFNSTDRPTEYSKLLKKFDDLIDNDGDYNEVKEIIKQIESLYKVDKATEISHLIDELNIKLSAYQFDKEYEKDK